MSSAASSDSSPPQPAQKAQEDLVEHTEKPQSQPAPGAAARFLNSLPSWVSTNLRSHRSLKVLLRCWAASWLCFIILLPDNSLKTLGNTAFFALLASVFVPPYIPVQMFFFILSTLMVGALFGWGIGAAAMRSALAVRNQLLVKETLQRQQSTLAPDSNPDAVFQASIFQGDFLDTKSSVMFGFFLCLGSFIAALVRVYAPNLLIMSIYMTISTDIFCTIGPLFPFAQYTLLNSFLISVSSYCAIGIVFLVFLFPESLNHQMLNGTARLLEKVKGLIELQETVLDSKPGDLGPGTALTQKISATKTGTLMAFHQSTALLKFINFEVNWGKWNGDDVKALEEPLLGVVTRTAAMQTFSTLLGRSLLTGVQGSSPSTTETDEKEKTKNEEHSLGDATIFKHLLEKNAAAEERHSVRLHDVLPTIKEATAPLRAACCSTLDAVREVIISVNTKRYSRKAAPEAEARVQALQQAITNLQSALENFISTDRLMLVRPFEALIAETHRERTTPLRSLYVTHVFASNLVGVSQIIVKFAESVLTIAHKRTRNRLWMPSGIRHIFKAIASRNEDRPDQAIGEEAPPDLDDKHEMEQKSYRRDPDSRPPTNVFQRFGLLLFKLYKWLGSPEGLFVVKYVLISIALYVPAVIKNSAHIYYAERGLWALIMAQITLNIYTSDQMFNYIFRLLGTFFGAIYGLLCWYIGAGKGKGSGNPYGMAASVAVFLVPVVFVRVFAPPQYLSAVLLFAATFTLIIGYSWINGHLVVTSDVGIGWAVAWRRWVLVVIGCAASFVMMMFPPRSGRTALRLRDAAIIAELSDTYAKLMSAWVSEAVGQKGTIGNPEWVPEFRRRILSVAQQIQQARVQTAMAAWEGNIRGPWPRKEYEKICNLMADMMASLAQLGGSLAVLDPEMRLSFLAHTKSVNPNFISDVMSTFQLVSQSIRTGEPLNRGHYSNLLERLHYHAKVVHTGPAEEPTNSLFDISQITSYNYMFYATAVVAVWDLIEGLNDLRRTTVELCGEIPLSGYDEWRVEYERAHLMA